MMSEGKAVVADQIRMLGCTGSRCSSLYTAADPVNQVNEVVGPGWERLGLSLTWASYNNGQCLYQGRAG